MKRARSSGRATNKPINNGEYVDGGEYDDEDCDGGEYEYEDGEYTKDKSSKRGRQTVADDLPKIVSIQTPSQFAISHLKTFIDNIKLPSNNTVKTQDRVSEIKTETNNITANIPPPQLRTPDTRPNLVIKIQIDKTLAWITKHNVWHSFETRFALSKFFDNVLSVATVMLRCKLGLDIDISTSFINNKLILTIIYAGRTLCNMVCDYCTVFRCIINNKYYIAYSVGQNINRFPLTGIKLSKDCPLVRDIYTTFSASLNVLGMSMKSSDETVLAYSTNIDETKIIDALSSIETLVAANVLMSLSGKK